MPTDYTSDRDAETVQLAQVSSDQLSSPIQVAQIQMAQTQLAQGAAGIGSVSSLTGQATIIRATGETVQAEIGTAVFQDDTFETGSGGGVGLTFDDGSSFSLGPDARLTIDSFVYDAGGADSNMVMNLAQGAFSFVSGQVAKSGDNNMTIVTPTATIGIRGTAGAGDDDEIVLLQEPGQQIGELTVTTQGGTVSLTTPNSYTSTSNPFAPPSPPAPRSLGDIQSLFGGALRQLPVQLPANQNLPAGDGGTGGTGGTGESGQDGAGQEGEQGEAGEGENGEGGEGAEGDAGEGEGQEGEGEEGEEGEGEGEEGDGEEGEEGEGGEGEGGEGGEGEQGAENPTAPLTLPSAGQKLAPPPPPPPPPPVVAPPPKAPDTPKPPGPPPPGDPVDPIPGGGGGGGGGEAANVIPVNANSTVTLTGASDQIEVSGPGIAVTVLGTLQSGDSIIDVTNDSGQSLTITDIVSHSFSVNGIENVQFGAMTGSESHTISVGGTTAVAFNTSSGPFDADITGDGDDNTIKIGQQIGASSTIGVNLGAGTDTVDVNTSATVFLTLNNTEHMTNSLGGSQEIVLENGVSGLSVDLGAGFDSLFLADATNNLTVANVETLSGGLGNDTIIMNAALVSGDEIDGSSGIDTVTLQSGSSNTASFFSVEFINGVAGTTESLILENSVNGTIFDFGNLSDGDSLQLSNGTNVLVAFDIASITGGASNDTIAFNNASSNVNIDGGGGTDTVTNSSDTVSFFTFNNIEQFVGGSSANDHVTSQTALVSGAVFSGGSAGDTDVLNLAAGVNAASITFFEFINGTASNDDLTLESAIGITTVQLDLGGGLDTLNLFNAANTVTVSNIEFLNGGTGNDTVFMGTALLTGAQYSGGAGGTDTLNLLAGSTNLGTVSNFDFVNVAGGGAGTTESLTLEAILTGPATFDFGDFSDNDTLILASGGNALSVRDIANVTGNLGNDTVTMLSALVTGSAYDGGGSGDDSDELILLDDSTNSAVINDFEAISGNSTTGINLTFEAGSQVNTTFTFTGAGTDILHFNDGGSFASLNGVEEVFGGAGNDFVTVNDTTGVKFTLGDGGDTATGAVGVTDTFFYSAQTDANIAEGETITNFEIGTDIIDVAAIAAGNFSFIGGAAFTNASGSMEGRFADANTVEFDVNDDGVADMEITLSNGVAGSLTSADFNDVVVSA